MFPRYITVQKRLNESGALCNKCTSNNKSVTDYLFIDTAALFNLNFDWY